MRFSAFAFVAGAALFQCMPDLPSPFVYFLLAPLAFALRLNAPWRLLAIAGFGFLFALWRAEQVLNRRLDSENAGAVVAITGTVRESPVDFGLGQSFDLHAQAVRNLRGEVFDLPRLRVRWYTPPASLRIDATCHFMARLSPPRGTFNPAGFDREKWLFRERIAASAAVIAHPVNACTNRFDHWSLHAVRARVAEIIGTELAASPHHGVIAALAVGDRRALADDTWNILRATGTAHLLAISGLHISIVAGGAFFIAHWVLGIIAPLARRWPVQQPAAACAIVAALVYAALAGFPVSTVRALIMVAVAMILVMRRSRALSFDAYALAMLAVTLIDPLVLLGAGFWLSFAAVGGLLVMQLARPNAKLIVRLLQLHVLLALVLSPLIGLLQQNLPLASPLANLIAVPVVTLTVVPLVIAGLCVVPFSVAGAVTLWGYGAEVWGVLWRYLAWLNEVLAPFELSHAPQPLAILLAILGVAVALFPLLRARWLLCAVLIGALMLPQTAALKSGHFRTSVLDVGQGLAVVVETASHVLVYDTGAAYGAYSAAERIVYPVLRARGWRHIDRLVLSHGDNDHAGGWRRLAALARIDSLLLSPGHATSAPQPRCEAGQTWTWDGVEFEILAPLTQQRGGENDLSCVLRIANRHGSLLLAGDVERGAEAAMVERYGKNLASDVVLVPHHGSASSSTSQFVAAVNPSVAIISAGFRNKFAFPDPAVVRRYAAHGAQVVNTADTGAIEITVSERIEAPRAWRHVARRYWHYRTTHPR